MEMAGAADSRKRPASQTLARARGCIQLPLELPVTKKATSEDAAKFREETSCDAA